MGEWRVLIIDDNPDILFTFQAIAEYAGWRAETAGDGYLGLEKVKGWVPHLIIVDYHMPEMNGREFIRKLRDFDTTTPVMVLTVDEDQELADSLLEAGATDFALKPLRAPDLIARVSLHLKLPPAKQQLSPPKGISHNTLNLIIQCLMGKREYKTIDEVAGICRLSYQSAHRYLTYLEQEDRLEFRDEYGEVGRPRRLYRWRESG